MLCFGKMFSSLTCLDIFIYRGTGIYSFVMVYSILGLCLFTCCELSMSLFNHTCFESNIFCFIRVSYNMILSAIWC